MDLSTEDYKNKLNEFVSGKISDAEWRSYCNGLLIENLPDKQFIKSLREIANVYFASKDTTPYFFLIEACRRLENKLI